MDIHNKPNAPRLEFHFINGTTYTVDPANSMESTLVLRHVFTRAEIVMFDLEIDGKDPLSVAEAGGVTGATTTTGT